MGAMSKQDIGSELFADLVNLEKRVWNGEDTLEEDKTLLSNIVDYVEYNLDDFKNYCKERSEQ